MSVTSTRYSFCRDVVVGRHDAEPPSQAPSPTGDGGCFGAIMGAEGG
eukprot:COSAG01_NODE_64931_length_274_cov_116.400000_1_plen_46_part_01